MSRQKRWSDTCIRFSAFFLFLLWSLAFTPNTAAENRAANKAVPEKRAALIDYLNTDNAFETEDLTSQLLPLLAQSNKLERLSYEQLQAYYKRVLKKFAGHFPAQTFSINPQRVLRGFRGTLNIEDPETYKIPFMLMSPQVYDQQHLVFEKLESSFRGRKILGLRIRTRAAPLFLKLPTNTLSLPYLPDINARALGFTHAQLIPKLSENVVPARRFVYNGLRKWSEHQRYTRTDQISRPIALNNFAHRSVSKYLISPHPDFSLDCPNFKTKPITLTFFLWKTPKDLPDFVYQIVFEL